MKNSPLLNDLFSFIDNAKISGTLSFPLKDSYDPNAPLGNRLWHTVELTNKRIYDLPEHKFKLAATSKAELTLASINLNILNSANNISFALDSYLSAFREVETRLEYLKTLTDQEIIFNNLDDVQQTPPGDIENLEFTHYSALVEFLITKVLMGLQQNLDNYISILSNTSTYSEFFNLLNEKLDIKKNTIRSTKPKDPINTLEDAVRNDDALNKILTLLIEAELIDQDTKILKDKTSGYKGHFYSTIILFNEKGYFKRKPHISEYLNICNNTFKADIRESTAKNHQTRPKSTLTIPSFSLSD